MKPCLPVLLALVALVPAAVRANGMNIDLLVNRLDQLVHLSASQKAQATEVFTQENNALQAFSTAQESLTKGMNIRVNARAQIRALLTPEQQEIYDTTPQRLGGGSMRDYAAATSRLDAVVTLTDDQIAKIGAIFRQRDLALQPLTRTELLTKGAEIHRAAAAQARALLTPEQQRKYDDNPGGVEDLEERAFVIAYIKSSPAIAARLGSVTAVSHGTGSFFKSTVDGQIQAMKGSYAFYVRGSIRADAVSVDWVKASVTAPITVVKIVAGAGDVIGP